MAHRAEAQKITGITEKQWAGLAKGSVKGTNHRAGYKHREESKRKASESHKRFNAENPDFAKARGEKLRGDRHYKWKGGVTALNKAVRRMTENRRWMDAVKARDGKCLRCGAVECLETHHIQPLGDLIETLEIRTVGEARNVAALWDLANGETLCERCHYAEHGRVIDEARRQRRRKNARAAKGAVQQAT